MIARRRPVRAGRRWPARRTSNHARTSQVDRATDDPIRRFLFDPRPGIVDLQPSEPLVRPAFAQAGLTACTGRSSGRCLGRRSVSGSLTTSMPRAWALMRMPESPVISVTGFPVA